MGSSNPPIPLPELTSSLSLAVVPTYTGVCFVEEALLLFSDRDRVAGHQWFTPVILDIWEDEIGRIVV
jgi:hypothetical protein